MALNISGYVDPGVYQRENNISAQVPGVATSERICLIGPGPRTRTMADVPVRRGARRELVSPTLVADGSYEFELSASALRIADRLAIARDGEPLRTSGYDFRAPELTLTGITAAIDFDSIHTYLFGLEVDGQWMLAGLTNQAFDDGGTPRAGQYVSTRGVDGSGAYGGYITYHDTTATGGVGVTADWLANALCAIVGARLPAYNLTLGGTASFAQVVSGDVRLVAGAASSAPTLRIIGLETAGASGVDGTTVAGLASTAGRSWRGPRGAVGYTAPVVVRISSALYQPGSYEAIYVETADALDPLTEAAETVNTGLEGVGRVFPASGGDDAPDGVLRPVRLGSTPGNADYLRDDGAGYDGDFGRILGQYTELVADPTGYFTGAAADRLIAAGALAGDRLVADPAQGAAGLWGRITLVETTASRVSVEWPTGLGALVGVLATSFTLFRPTTATVPGALSAVLWVGQSPSAESAPTAAGLLDIGSAVHATSGRAYLTLRAGARPTVLVDLIGQDVGSATAVGLPPVVGAALVSNTAQASLAAIAGNINARLAAHAAYGPLFSDFAEVVTTVNGQLALRFRYGLRMLSEATEDTTFTFGLNVGVNDNNIVDVSTSIDNALVALFGTGAATLGYVTADGRGKRPSSGSPYYISVVTERPASHYNIPRQFFSRQDTEAEFGNGSGYESGAMLGYYAQLAWAPQPSSIVVVQVDDRAMPGVGVRSEWQAAIRALDNNDGVTILVPLTTDVAIQTDFRNAVERTAGPTEQLLRQVYFGMPRGTEPGNRDTADTFIYRAQRTMQVNPDSPGRGRFFVFAPPQRAGISATLVDSANKVYRIPLPSVACAVAAAARRTTFDGPYESLSGKFLTTDWNVDDVTHPWTKGERQLMAANGVAVVAFDADSFRILDCVSTEQGAGNVPKFIYDNTAPQKDALSRQIKQAVYSNLIYTNPTSPVEFVSRVRSVVGGIIKQNIARGFIGPYRTAGGGTRSFSSSDVIATIDPVNPSSFHFSYSYYLRYTMLRGFGEFVVDAPVDLIG
jgi:hypothetical protein